MRLILALTALLALLPAFVRAQGFDAVGTRAAGMAGAFVAVADDASAVYWNPGALASGALFSAVIDRSSGRATEDAATDRRGGSRSGALVALATPPLGLAYYRLRSTRVAALPGAASEGSADVLVTHHTGATLVQSLADGIAVGATLKFVRGIATLAGVGPGSDVGELLDEAGDLVGQASNAFDTDIGLSVVRGAVRAGITVRNLTSPNFEAPGGGELELERQARVGVSLTSPRGFLVALDADLNAVTGRLGKARDLAVGAEARLVPRAQVRAGVRLNTIGDEPGGRAPSFSAGASYAALASFWVDAQATLGPASATRGWGVAGRVVF